MQQQVNDIIFIDIKISESLECEAGTYGVNCKLSCGEFCLDTNSCDRKDGRCSCTNWGVGELCDREIGTFIHSRLNIHTYSP